MTTPANAMASLANGGVPPVAPDTTSSQASPTPQPTTQPTPTPTPTAQPSAPPQASLHARIFDKILKGMSGGDVKVIGPDGTVQTIPQSRASMGKSIVAAALTGLMTPTHYRSTPFGDVIDYNAGATDAAGRMKASLGERQQKAQALSDEQQSRKLQFFQNNAKLLQERLASAHMKHENWQQQQTDAKPFLDALHQYDQERPNDPSVPKAILFEGLTHQEALDKAKESGLGLTEANYIPDGGWKPAVGESGEQEMEPTYAIMNPSLDKVSLTPEIAKKLSTVSSQYDNITDKVGGPVKIPQNMWVSAWHDYSNLQRVNEALSRLNKTVNGKDAKDVDLSSAVRGNRRLVPELGKVVNALATGQAGTGEGENPANVLDVLLKNAPEFLSSLNMTTEQAAEKRDDLTADRAAKMAKAKNEGSMKMAADQADIDQVKKAAAVLPPQQRDTVLSGISGPDEDITKQQIKDARTVLGQFQRANDANSVKVKLQNGDPEQAGITAKNILDGAYGDIKDIASFKGQARENLMNAIVAEARNRGLDISRWGEDALKSKNDMWQQYHSTDRNKVGAQISSFRVFLDHVNDAMNANDNWKRANSPLLNQPLNWIAKNATNDPNYQLYKESLLPAAKEFMSFLNQNRAEHTEDIRAMESILDGTATPLQAEVNLKALAGSADKRLADLAYAYNANIGTTMPEMLTPSSRAILAKLPGGSKAAQIIRPLPRGNGQVMTDRAVRDQFLAAAGQDKMLAMEMAKQAGWKLQ